MQTITDVRFRRAPLDWLSIAEVLNVDLTGTKQDAS